MKTGTIAKVLLGFPISIVVIFAWSRLDIFFGSSSYWDYELEVPGDVSSAKEVEHVIPSSLPEAVEILLAEEGPKGVEILRRIEGRPDEILDAVERHYRLAYEDGGYGMGLRNGWELWGRGRLAKWFRWRDVRHPDDMSGIVLGAVVAAARGHDYDVFTRQHVVVLFRRGIFLWLITLVLWSPATKVLARVKTKRANQ